MGRDVEVCLDGDPVFDGEVPEEFGECKASGEMKIPFVVYAACWSRAVSPARFRTSMGTLSCWAANMAFVRGMYCEARSAAEVETISIRAASAAFCGLFRVYKVTSKAAAFCACEAVGVRERRARLM